MPGGVIYLDIDDEITSAAARIRTVEGRRVAVVLPHGSRVATSRINFRLLARDALTHEKRLSIIANDPATRALAASAGLPVFSSVGEYEGSEEAPPPTPAPRADDASATSAAAAAALAGETARTSLGEPPDTSTPAPPVQQTLDEMEAAELAAAAAALRTTAAPATGARGSRPPRGTSIRDSPGGTSIREAPVGGSASDPRVQDAPVRGGPVTRGSGRGLARTPVLVGLIVVVLAVVIGGVGAYLVLPSATIVVSPKEEALGPVRVTIRADPTATAPNAADQVVPAEVVSLDVTTTDSFPATGKRVAEKKASGTVRFENLDPTSSNTIPSGSVVRTSGGVRFRTNAAVTVPRADLVGLGIIPKTASVKVTAVEPGPEGNVDANRITQVPRDENGTFLNVTNPDPTTGGAREEFPKVTQKDIDGALAALEPALQAALAERLTDPSIAPAGATVFPETAVLGTPVPSVDPTTLLDQEVATFNLGLSAPATVTTVNEAPVETVVADQLRASVDANHRLLDGTIDVVVEPAVIDGDEISFPASATARQVAILDPDELKAQVVGRPIEEARSILERFGTVKLSVWPDWVTTIPTLDGRVELTLDEAVAVETPGPSATP